MKFRKKTVVIEAYQWNGHNRQELIQVFGMPPEMICAVNLLHSSLFIQTLEGEMEAKPGDWIIRGVKGEYYPCKPDIFAATYEPVAEGVSA